MCDQVLSYEAMFCFVVAGEAGSLCSFAVLKGVLSSGASHRVLRDFSATGHQHLKARPGPRGWNIQCTPVGATSIA